MSAPDGGMEEFRPVDDPDAVPIRDASTVVLVRDAPGDATHGDGIEVFCIQRVKEMAFAGGMTVFPGGGVDLRDAESDVAWTGPPASWWAERFGADNGRIARIILVSTAVAFLSFSGAVGLMT